MLLYHSQSEVEAQELAAREKRLTDLMHDLEEAEHAAEAMDAPQTTEQTNNQTGATSKRRGSRAADSVPKSPTDRQTGGAGYALPVGTEIAGWKVLEKGPGGKLYYWNKESNKTTWR